MRHPDEATLALFAGGDLGLYARWQAGRHLAGCERCRREVEGFGAMRNEAAGLGDLPGIPWNRLAAEMKANIRLGLEAGEIVGGRDEARRPAWWDARALVVYASAVALIVAGLVLERPGPGPAALPPQEGTVLRVTASGIELQDGGQVLSLLHKRDQEVTYSVGAQGALRARFVEGGSVTINSVYAQ